MVVTILVVWILIVKPRKTHVSSDHPLRIESGEEPTRVEDDLPDALFFKVEYVLHELEGISWFLHDGITPKGMPMKKQKILETIVSC